MSWDLITTSPKRRFATSGIFRMEEGQPFDPGLFGHQAQGARGPGMQIAQSARCRAQPIQSLHPMRALQSLQPAPSIFSAPYDPSEEKAPLQGYEQRRRDGMDLTNAITLCAAVSLWVLIVAFISIMYWQFTASVSTLRDTTRPYIEEMINHTMSILYNVDHSTVGAHDVVDGARSITASAVPALQHALNQSQAMINRLEELARHPVLQLSLGTGNVGGAGR